MTVPRNGSFRPAREKKSSFLMSSQIQAKSRGGYEMQTYRLSMC